MLTAPTEASQIPLVEEPSTSTIHVNGHCLIRDEEGMRVIVLRGLVVAHYHHDDGAAQALAAAQLMEAGHAKPGELASALKVGVATVHRYRQRYLAGGVEGVVLKKRGPKGQRLDSARKVSIRQWHAQGMSMTKMARRLSVSQSTVRLALERMGLPIPGSTAKQPALVEAVSEAPVSAPSTAPVVVDSTAVAPAPGGSAAESAPAWATLDTDPMNRAIDRMLARRGQLDDAAPFFASARGLARVGVLLAVPMLVASGLFEAAKATFGSLMPAFYGLRTTLLTLELLALLRIKSPENLKEYAPPDLGRLLGLDRAPEVKTLRGKLERLAADGREEAFLKELVNQRVQTRAEALGYLYVDGHVRVYSGEVDIPKTHVARMRLALPATQDTWVNDAAGDPLFFVTHEAHPQLVSAFPPILTAVRALVGNRRVTVVFDRGGWSPKLFETMEKDGFDVLTYRKGSTEPIPVEDFIRHEVPGTAGKEHYELHDGEVTLLDGRFRMRQVTRRQDDHQTVIVTTRRDLGVVEVARRMFNRWRQENFFKYMRQQYAIDALVEYNEESADGTRLVPNPARKTLDKQLAKARRLLEQLETAYGAAAIDNPESQRPTMRGFKIAHGTALGIPLRQAREHVEQLLAQRRVLPTNVPVSTIKDHVVQLPRARKRLSDGLKMLAYQVESDLARAIAPHYARSLDEGRRLVHTIFQTAGDIDIVPDELRITLAPLSSPHRTKVASELCRLLNETATQYPGTTLRLKFAVRSETLS